MARQVPGTVIQTTIFKLCNGRYRSVAELARAMGLSVSHVYRVREGRRGINHAFIVGAKRAFPERSLDELFYLEEVGSGERPAAKLEKTYRPEGLAGRGY